MVTAQQIEFFSTFGYLLLERSFRPRRCPQSSRRRTLFGRQMRRADYTKSVVPFIENKPLLARLPEDDRIYK